MTMSPWNQNSPFVKSPWSSSFLKKPTQTANENGLLCSLVREEGHVYSLAAKNGILYTGSDSENVRVWNWKNMREFSAFKSNSGLVKAILICGDKIYTGHQDGMIRAWKINPKDPSLHKRSGTYPAFVDIFKASIGPKNYAKHSDAISCLSMNQETGLLYSASWDGTFRVWRVKDSKCFESVKAHKDAVNSIISSIHGNTVFTGSADGTVKAWRREQKGKILRHVLTQTLLHQQHAVTALTVSDLGSNSIVYCGSSDGMVNLWEMDQVQKEQLKHSGVLKGHKLAVLCLATAGILVFSGSADKSIRVWRRDQGPAHSCISVLTGHTGPVKCLAIEEDFASAAGDQKWIVYSGSLDKSVKVWSLS